MMNWLLVRINYVITWFSSNLEKLDENIDKGVRRFARNISRFMLIGVILNVVASYFYPDFPERFPVIYGWFDGWLQLGEFAIKVVLNGIYSFFTGNWSEFWTGYNEAYKELLCQFVNWLNTIRF